MKIPSKLNIQGHQFEILRHSREKTGNADLGTIMGSHNKIWINDSISQSQQEATLIHEIIEFANESFELNLDHRTICTLEAVLYQTLRDNNLLR